VRRKHPKANSECDAEELSLPNTPRDHPTAPRSPWQNGHVERLIGSIRRECLDHIVVVGEAPLRHTLKACARYYNEVRTHRSLDKDTPEARPIQFTGSILSRPLLGGLHHHYFGFSFRYRQASVTGRGDVAGRQSRSSVWLLIARGRHGRGKSA
jgi:hypothetical protein